jgi:hypothetical protein
MEMHAMNKLWQVSLPATVLLAAAGPVPAWAARPVFTLANGSGGKWVVTFQALPADNGRKVISAMVRPIAGGVPTYEDWESGKPKTLDPKTEVKVTWMEDNPPQGWQRRVTVKGDGSYERSRDFQWDANGLKLLPPAEPSKDAAGDSTVYDLKTDRDGLRLNLAGLSFGKVPDSKSGAGGESKGDSKARP